MKKYNVRITEVNGDNTLITCDLECQQDSINDAWAWVFDQAALDAAVKVEITEEE